MYWGFMFLAAMFSTLAGVILKVESFLKNNEVKKDVAALLSVSAALLITICTELAEASPDIDVTTQIGSWLRTWLDDGVLSAVRT